MVKTRPHSALRSKRNIRHGSLYERRNQHHSRWQGIDACVPAAIADDMMQLAGASGQMKDFWLVQFDVGGRMLLDITVPAPLASLILAKAKQHIRTA